MLCKWTLANMAYQTNFVLSVNMDTKFNLKTELRQRFYSKKLDIAQKCSLPDWESIRYALYLEVYRKSRSLKKRLSPKIQNEYIGWNLEACFMYISQKKEKNNHVKSECRVTREKFPIQMFRCFFEFKRFYGRVSLWFKFKSDNQRKKNQKMRSDFIIIIVRVLWRILVLNWFLWKSRLCCFHRYDRIEMWPKQQNYGANALNQL